MLDLFDADKGKDTDSLHIFQKERVPEDTLILAHCDHHHMFEL